MNFFFFFVSGIHSMRKNSLVEWVSERLRPVSQSWMQQAEAAWDCSRSSGIMCSSQTTRARRKWVLTPISSIFCNPHRSSMKSPDACRCPELTSLLFPSLSFHFLHFSAGLFLWDSWSLAAALFLSPPPPTFFFLGVFLELGFACMRLLGYFTASLGFLLDDGWAGSSFVLKSQDLMSPSSSEWPKHHLLLKEDLQMFIVDEGGNDHDAWCNWI